MAVDLFNPLARPNESFSIIPRAVMNAALLENKINICHLNIQSLCARQLSKFEEFKNVFIGSKLDLICLSETWLTDSVSDNIISMDGYKLLRNDRKYSRGGGLCVYYKSDLNCKIIAASDLYADPIPMDRTEYLFVEVRINDDKFLVGTFYSPPDSDCSSMLEEKLSELSLNYTSTILTGDFNTDLLKFCPKTTRFKNTIESFGLECLNEVPTHFHSDGSSLIDLLLANSKELIVKFNQVSAAGFSKHDIIFASLNFSRSNSNSGHRCYRDYSRIDYPQLQSALESIDWDQLYTINNSDLALDFFNLHIFELYEAFVPERICRPKRDAVWFNNEIRFAMVERDLAYSTWRQTQSEHHFAQFKRLRNRVTQLINKAKRDKLSSTLLGTNSNKQLWNKLKQINIKSNKNDNIEFSHTANEINEFFGENFTEVTEYPSIPPANADGFHFRVCDESDVVIALSSITSNAVGLDGIPLKFIKLILPSVITQITYIFNVIFRSSNFPSSWKTAKIIPIRKKPRSSDLSNLRPISILCSLSKVFERIAKNQIQMFITRYKLLTPYQSGFRSGHSTTTALLKVHDDIHRVIDKKGVALLLLIDFSKAFDRVSHSKLLRKLSQNFYFSRSAVTLISSYLSCRTQVVSANGELSNGIHIISGVPQGSVLGPLLFSLFINDLPAVLEHCMIHIFADDVQLYICSMTDSLETVARLINIDLRNVVDWSSSNLLPINTAKTKVMYFNRRGGPQSLPDIFVQNDKLDYVVKASNLGVVFQSNLEWDSHINNQCCKIYSGLRHLKLTGGMVSRAIKIELIKSLLLPHFLYGIELIMNASSIAFRRLRVALNSCIRWAFNVSRYSSVSHLQHEILGCSFNNFIKLRCCLSLFKISKNGPKYLSDKLLSFRSTRVRNYTFPQYSSSHYGDSFFVRAIEFWNQLSADIKTINSYGRFRKECIDWFNEGN